MKTFYLPPRHWIHFYKKQTLHMFININQGVVFRLRWKMTSLCNDDLTCWSGIFKTWVQTYPSTGSCSQKDKHIFVLSIISILILNSGPNEDFLFASSPLNQFLQKADTSYGKLRGRADWPWPTRYFTKRTTDLTNTGTEMEGRIFYIKTTWSTASNYSLCNFRSQREFLW